MKIFHVFALILLPLLSFSQEVLMGISARYDDSFAQWTIYTDDEDAEGELEMRWSTQDDLTKWDFDVSGVSGRIETKWRDDLSEWQVFCDGEIVTMRPRWPRDFSEWRITDNKTTIYFKTRYSNSGDEWIISTEGHGWFTVYTEYSRDPRDWVIVDEMNEEVGMSMKMAMTFLAIFNTIPRD